MVSILNKYHPLEQILKYTEHIVDVLFHSSDKNIKKDIKQKLINKQILIQSCLLY